MSVEAVDHLISGIAGLMLLGWLIWSMTREP